jgi:hypothetical protein
LPKSSRPQPTTCCSKNKQLPNGLLLSIIMSFSAGKRKQLILHQWKNHKFMTPYTYIVVKKMNR